MRNGGRRLLFGAGIALAAALAWLAWRQFGPSGVTVNTGPYLETFDSAGTWSLGEDPDARALLVDGRYEMTVQLGGDVFWGTAGKVFADGVYEVEAVPLEGTLDNGYGMLLRVNQSDSDFYLLKVSSDGYVFAGLCRAGCAETTALVGNDWFASPAVSQGFGVTNRLRVLANGSELTFYVNDVEVGRVTDASLRSGDIGLLAETFAPGGLRVAFDNFAVTPLEP
jgi:hypothetical protein